RDLSRYLHTYVRDFIQPYRWAEFDFLAVAKGPGGFTGTRIGVVMARTLAQQLEIPLFGVSSLAAIAQQHWLNSQDPAANLTLAVDMPAQRGEVFGGIYQINAGALTVLLADQITAQDQWQQQLDQWPEPVAYLHGTGGLAASVEGVLALAIKGWEKGDRPGWETVLPFYGQHPVR
ncbi:MAG: tRNA (adenosine(37)-N6)-threonylcarbamoyltransferase complex dimerization subunit type 1 TsaB, partial [Cyanobacteria bacterium]|nr:tRNA (adenosine(37)-N6)-threonylcarbamoyltransferase complex dimerization subunit type 1 TsaB [Cyanobacteriota bacterium]